MSSLINKQMRTTPAIRNDQCPPPYLPTCTSLPLYLPPYLPTSLPSYHAPSLSSIPPKLVVFVIRAHPPHFPLGYSTLYFSYPRLISLFARALSFSGTVDDIKLMEYRNRNLQTSKAP